MKAFIVNRVGDVFFMLGMALTFWTFGTIEFDGIFQGVAAAQGKTIGGYPVLEVISLLLFLGAMGKSAQIGLHTWLPDAMEGPTPVSALIHAATLVTAGVFLMARMSPVVEYAPNVLGFITFIGATTAFFAATIGCVQNDIKRVIAYSTCSQLGYMFFAVGVGAYQGAIFHLFTHAFFKALLFLSAGSVIHAMSDEQDIRKMGGIWKKIPLTYAMFWIGSLALAGIPFFAGYFSKDFVLEAAYAGHGWTAKYAFAMGMIAALLTAFYSWRLIILTFHGKPRADHHTMEHVHESPAVMTVPLMVLALGALFTGAVFVEHFVGHDWLAFWNGSIINQPNNHIMHEAHEVPSWVPLAPTVAGVVGIALGYVFYMFAPAIPGRIAAAFPGVYRFLLNKWYFDELYDFLFVRPARRLALWLWKVGDARVIDGMPNGAAALTANAAGRVARFQTGRVANYAFTMIVGLVLFVSIFLFGIGR
jgi:NADH-quinone oxidoreductase subunit L